MQLVESIIHVLAAALTALLILIFPHPAIVQPAAPAPAPTHVTTSTTSAKTVATATTTPKVAPKTQAPAVAVSKPVTQPTPAPTPAEPSKPQEQINTDTRSALVNILCTTKFGVTPISGSGMIIDSRGVILTNAHVGQFFLLRDYYTPGNVDCLVRMGSPAEPYYHAELLYLPPSWVAANASQLVAAQATGTGENDYAFLRITGPVGTRVMPAAFPAVTLSGSEPDAGQEMLLAAYPAGYLGGEFITKSLYQTSAVTYVTQLFSYTGNKGVDLFSIGGTVVSQAGSSGGAVVSLQNGALKGIIATATVSPTTGTRDLRAITLAHINRSLAAENQGGLVVLLEGDIAEKAAAFNKFVAPTETAQLEAALGGGN